MERLAAMSTRTLQRQPAGRQLALSRIDCPASRIEGSYLAVDTRRMPRNRNRLKPISWNVYKIASKAVWLGEAEARDEAAAIETASQHSKYQPQS
jgi:hypothetical protein